jgi:DNA-binding CsgD family transcriptional regulator
MHLRLATGEPILAEVLADPDLKSYASVAWPLLVTAGLMFPDRFADLRAIGMPVTGPVQAAHRLMLDEEWDAGAAAWQEIGQPYPAAVALLRGAEQAFRDGDRATARARLRAAERVARDLGAAALLQEIERRSAATQPVLDLTPRESEVLRLVAAGRSNRQIGDALFISAKTAGVHVSNILMKLGVTSRTEAAVVAHRLGLTSPG